MWLTNKLNDFPSLWVRGNIPVTEDFTKNNNLFGSTPGHSAVEKQSFFKSISNEEIISMKSSFTNVSEKTI